MEKDFNLLRPLRPIHRVEVVILTRVAAQLGDAGIESMDDSNKGIDGDALRPRLARSALPIEVAAVVNPHGTATNRHLESLRLMEHDAAHRLGEMDMLMRVEMAGTAAHEIPEGIQLPAHLILHGSAILGVDDLVERVPRPLSVEPFPEVKVESETERWPGAAICRRSRRRRPPDHQTGTGEDAMLVGPSHAGVDAWRSSEIVTVDDEHPLSVRWICRVDHDEIPSVSLDASSNQSRACSAGATQSGAQPSHCTARQS